MNKNSTNVLIIAAFAVVSFFLWHCVTTLVFMQKQIKQVQEVIVQHHNALIDHAKGLREIVKQGNYKIGE